MQKTTKEKYVNTSLEWVREKLAEEGIVMRNLESLESTVILIGELYYELKKKEDLI